MRCFLLFMCLIAPVLGFSKDRDTLGVMTRIRAVYAPTSTFLYQPTNTIKKFAFYRNTIYRANTLFTWQPENQTFSPSKMGQGEQVGGVDITTHYIFDETSQFFAGATYHNGKIFNVKNNEISDFKELYPYVMGDTIGGDLTQEMYQFNMGYAKRLNKLILGGEFDYTAKHSFRTVDPRPQNIISNLNFNVSAAYDVMEDYIAGITFGFERYTQKSDIEFYDPLGGTQIFHYYGLGAYSTRFLAVSSSAFYKGNNWDIDLDLVPLKNKGLSVNLYYRNSKVDKLLTDVSDIILNELKKQDLKVKIAYISCFGNNQIGGKIETDVHKREGVENIFGGSGVGNYPLVGSSTNFKLSSYSYTAKLIWEKRFSKKFEWSLTPHFKMEQYDISRLTSSIKWDEQKYGAETSLNYINGSFWGYLLLNGSYRSVTNESVANLSQEVRNEFAPLLTARTTTKAEISFYKMLTERLALNFKTSINVEKYESERDYFQIHHSLGIVF